MGARGPRPDGAIERQGNRVNPPKRIRTPEGMNERAQKLFKEMIKSNDAKNLDPEVITMIHVYCDAYADHCTAMEHLHLEGLVVTENTKFGPVTKKSEYFNIRKTTDAIMASFSTKLRHKGIEVPVTDPKRSGLMFGGA